MTRYISFNRENQVICRKINVSTVCLIEFRREQVVVGLGVLDKPRHLWYVGKRGNISSQLSTPERAAHSREGPERNPRTGMERNDTSSADQRARLYAITRVMHITSLTRAHAKMVGKNKNKIPGRDTRFFLSSLFHFR
jgi:hypothetical protein